MAYDNHSSVGDLSKKTRVELTELLQRQEKLLANRKFIAGLPDKGAKICKFKEQLEAALSGKSDVDEAASLLVNLNLDPRRVSLEDLDSDDDDDDVNEMMQDPDVLRTLATNGPPVKVYSQSGSAGSIHQRLMGGSDKQKAAGITVHTGLAEKLNSMSSGPSKDPRRLNRPLRTDFQEQIHQRSLSKPKSAAVQQEESAVRYPTGPHESAVTLSLQESLQLQDEHEKRHTALQMVQSVEHLVERMNVKMGDSIPDRAINTIQYRNTNEVDSESDDNDGGAEDSSEDSG